MAFDEKWWIYINSREWFQKRDMVRQRSGGICEHCGKRPGKAIHHIHYMRKYHERLSDLLDVCKPCHDYFSYLSNYNPKTGLTETIPDDLFEPEVEDSTEGMGDDAA